MFCCLRKFCRGSIDRHKRTKPGGTSPPQPSVHRRYSPQSKGNWFNLFFFLLWFKFGCNPVLQGEQVFFVVTNFVETPNQRLGLCAEVRALIWDTYQQGPRPPLERWDCSESEQTALHNSWDVSLTHTRTRVAHAHAHTHTHTHTHTHVCSV